MVERLVKYWTKDKEAEKRNDPAHTLPPYRPGPVPTPVLIIIITVARMVDISYRKSLFYYFHIFHPVHAYIQTSRRRSDITFYNVSVCSRAKVGWFSSGLGIAVHSRRRRSTNQKVINKFPFEFQYLRFASITFGKQHSNLLDDGVMYSGEQNSRDYERSTTFACLDRSRWKPA